MKSVVRPLAVLGVASGVSLAAMTLTDGVRGSGTAVASNDEAGWGEDGATNPITRALDSIGVSTGSQPPYDLAQLELLETTLYHVEESYVEPSRIDWENMYTEALEGVEQRVPECMFRREPGGQLLHVDVGEAKTVLEVPKIESRRDLQRELKKVAAILEQNLKPEDIPVDDPTTDNPYAQIEYAMINGILGTLDPHSRLLPPEASKEMDVENSGEFGGLGITIKQDEDGKLVVDYPLPDTPAEKAGLEPNDQIARIDGVSTMNMSLDEAVAKLRGKVGDPVTIEIMRDGLSEPMKVTIQRDVIKLNEIEGQLLDGGIGYVAIKQYNAQVETQLKEQLTRLDREAGPGGLKGLIIDERGNPGGYLNQAEAVADMFLDHGTIVSQVDGSGKQIESYEAHSGNEPKYPIAVLVNASSASASEIVAGALRNNERAVIIGQRSYGKGSVQNLHPYYDGSKLKLTISKYLTPGDRSIQAVGIPADIELVPSIVEKEIDKKTGKPTGDNLALLWYTERVRREADADKHLEMVTARMEEPAYSIRYLRPYDLKDHKGAKLDLSGDFEVQVARDVLLAAPDARRADILASAAPVVAKYQKQGTKDLEKAFNTLGVDWTDGPPVQQAKLDVKLDLGPDAVLHAGKEQPVTLEVTNKGDKPIYRLGAVATFATDYPALEFYFGRIDPGQTKKWEQKLTLVDGYPTEVSPVTFTFRDESGKDVAVERENLAVQGNPLPRLTWQATVHDAAPGGDGDGVLEVGERATIDLVVENIGKGPTEGAYARIKNKSGRALDIVTGNLEPGVMLTKDTNQACQVTVAGVENGKVVGDASTEGGKAAVDKGDPPTYATGCHRVLAPGEKWTGSFVVTAKEAAPDGLDIDLEVGDEEAYDHAAIAREGFYTYFGNKEKLHLPVGTPVQGQSHADATVTAFPKANPPIVQITKAPSVTSDGDHVTVSGVVSDDNGVQYVMMYSNKDKVFYQGSVRGSHVRSIPFTADIQLEPGLNTIAVLATDDDGYTDTASVVTFWNSPDLQAKNGALKPDSDVDPVERLK